jgi:3-hydroxyacyl-CoA dehydrogenase/enoyl-CoA hydratase/3-hydroxybutyryl-CoA epimerase
MPLVEIIPGEQTSPETIATLFGVAKKMGKSPIIVKDVAGFLVNRILLAYMNEAARCLEDGAKVEQVDRLILDFGMPMGPFHLTDEVGIAVGYHVAHTLASAYGERMAVAKALNVIHNDMQLIGKRSGSGFYQWKGHEKQVNPEVIAQVESLGAGKTLDDKTIVERCIFTMVKEAVLCCDEGVVESPAHLDMAMILGTGFPPFRGGLIRYLDQYGCSAATDTLARLQDQWGQRFSPPEGLIDRVKHNRSFYGD